MFQINLHKKPKKIDVPILLYPPTKKVFLFTNARNEKHIKEWAFHHLLIGFDHVFIFDHQSLPPIVPFDRNVTIIRCNMQNPVKMYLMNEALKIAKMYKADWFIYLDADEFIILNDFTPLNIYNGTLKSVPQNMEGQLLTINELKGNPPQEDYPISNLHRFKGIKEMLQKYHHAHSLSLNWLMFGTNHHIREPPGLIFDNYTKSEKKLHHHVKTFVRPNEVIRSVNPHYYLMKNSNKLFNLNNQLMNPHTLAFNPINSEYSEVPAYIAHYIYQSQETYINRKIKLPTDDTGIIRSLDKDIHNRYNDIENNDPKNKYSERLHQTEKKMDNKASSEFISTLDFDETLVDLSV